MTQEELKAGVQTTLETLKKNSIGKLKAYCEPIDESQSAFIGELFCTYAIEDGLVRQAVLTISHKDGNLFEIPADLSESIKNVFGAESMICRRTYPNRGFCNQYVFGVTNEKV